ncbi:major facilitator superfamily transporter [Purpureocillium lavendulum]|uniref:Major facilitator superfamily transporter n=1 Tax=Purpureocillium lavendulum TaxID=1247861 RepID=A0AB34FQE2_9HYPO|nr:major facilitator superfamily transporter [Purpureocillium lavendulum]
MSGHVAMIFAALMAALMIHAQSVPGYGVEPLEWNVDIAPGRTAVLNGTVQEVYAQILQIKPDYTLADVVAVPEPRALRHKRSTVKCGNFALAEKRRIVEGINYLRRVPGAPRNGPGPGNCGRNTSPKTLDSWDAIANSAQHIVNTCGPSASHVSGQNFESSNWNTIVRRDTC